MRIVLALALFVLVPFTALATPAPLEARVLVPIVPGLDDALAATGSTLLRADERLGFAVVLTPDADALARALDAPIESDARGAASTFVETPIASWGDDTYAPAQWALAALNAPQAWAIERGSAAVKVAVVDSGIHASHPDLVAVPVILGNDYVDDDASPLDTNGHGTHVAGIIAATKGNGRGVMGLAEVTLVVVRVLDGSGSGWCSDFASGIRESADKGAHVINLSLYCSADSLAVRDAVTYATSKGALVIAAAGNFQTTNPGACVTFPARYSNVVAVAALDPTLQTASYSCRGPEVDVAAPGSYVLSTVTGNAYALYSGTSMATPYAAATAALVKSHTPGLTMTQVRSVLESTAVDLWPPGRDSATGAGMAHPVAALDGLPAYVP